MYFIKHVLFILLVTSFLSCDREKIRVTGSGNIISKTIDLSSFEAVKLTGTANVKLRTGSTIQAVVEDYENLIQYWDVEIIGNTLTISNTSGVVIQNSDAKIFITAPPDLIAIETTGTGDVVIESDLVHLREISQTGSGNISASADFEVGQLEVNINGSGDLNFENVKSDSLYCVVVGSGDISIQVADYLEAKLLGSGNVFYSGNPELLIDREGSGDVIQM